MSIKIINLRKQLNIMKRAYKVIVSIKLQNWAVTILRTIVNNFINLFKFKTKLNF